MSSAAKNEAENVWARWPASRMSRIRKVGVGLMIAVELVLSSAGATPAVELSYFSIKRIIRAVRKGRPHEFMVSVVRASRRPQRVRFTLAADSLGVGTMDAKPESWIPLSQLSLRAIFSGADEASIEYRDLVALLAPKSDKAVAIVDGLGDILATDIAIQDLALLGAIAGWPGPNHIRCGK
jgi:hypothetical protein